MIRTRTTTDFFKADKPIWAVYDATRKLPNYVDGLKISQRKLLWVAFDKCVKDYLKTETFANITSLETAYIHGASNLCSVCASLVQNFIGACNYPYLIGNDGGWGSRLVTRESAPRYTKVKLAEVTKYLFNKIDNEILEKQYFEGQYIEPRTLIPIFPTIFLNSSSGLTAGFSSNIYSRNPSDIINYIKKKISGTEKPRIELAPWFNGYKGTIRYNKEDSVYESVGCITQNNMTSYTITEIPVETSYQKYIEILDKLVEDGIIQDYEDKCNPRNNELLFEIKTTREFTRKHQDLEALYKVFKLVRSLPEQYNCIDEGNRVREFSSVQEILDSFIAIRLKYYSLRKEYLLKTIKNNLEKLVSKYLFCDGIIKKTIKVANVKKNDIIAQLDKVDRIIKVDDSYSYLLNMPMHSVSVETLAELKDQIMQLKDQHKKIKETTIENMWIEDLNQLKKVM